MAQINFIDHTNVQRIKELYESTQENQLLNLKGKKTMKKENYSKHSRDWWYRRLNKLKEQEKLMKIKSRRDQRLAVDLSYEIKKPKTVALSYEEYCFEQ